MNKWLLVILTLGMFLRLVWLSSVPPSPSLDEVSIGYNAYSILQTGKDEYGMPFPMLLRAYDDWRPALYVYFVVPFVKLFGLNALAVRLPSVVLSILTVYLTYLLAQKLFNTTVISLIASLLLAISPWHIYISRLGHEVNLGLFAGVAAMYFFLKNSVILSSLFFTVSLYSYQSQKVVIPLILLVLGFFYRKKVIPLVLITFFIAIPLLKLSFTERALIRFQATRAPIKHFWSNYITHFDPRWLFSGTERENHKVPNMGLLYWWELPLILLGLMKLKGQARNIVLLWLFISPLPGAITTQAPHAMRTMTSLPYWQIIGAVGLASLWSSMKKIRFAILLIIGASIMYFAKNYYWIFPTRQSDSFQYALTQSIGYVVSAENTYERIVFSNQNNLYQSYMFFLFHSRYDPEKYLKDGGTISGGFAETHTIGKYEFRPIDWKKDRELKNTLFIGNTKDFPAEISPTNQFYYLDGTVGVVAIGT